MLLIDAANVVGSRPDGWWRDRAGAARRLAGRLVAALTEAPGQLAGGIWYPYAGADLRVHLVLEGAAARVPDLPSHPALDVVRATADGDSAIADLAARHSGDPVVVVTADRALRDRVRRYGADTVGPHALLDVLPG